MILGFKKQFPVKILIGEKIITIRTDKHNRWKPGRMIQFATGVRTKQFNVFKLGICVSTQEILITKSKEEGIYFIHIDKRFFYTYWKDKCKCDSDTEARMLDLAKSDGFNSIEEFLQWFDKGIEGKIIHWTEKRF